MLDTTFIMDLASKAPTPGGGGASAYVGALSSALGSMVGNLTVGKKRYEAVEADTYIVLEKLADERTRLIGLVDEDARAFAPLAAAYGMPKATPEELAEKDRVMQQALVGACEVPLDIMRSCAHVIDLCEFLAYNGSRMVLSDVGVAVAFGKAALLGASLNVFINAKDIADRGRAKAYIEEADRLVDGSGALADKLYAYVLDEIR
ncbi:cyclodeaminase/cyclohydrolase family protein [Raoultibacter massiliensis]|uniref:Cyclodeaminase/cyclohydrolase family protein n=1 Tax=Raoultibacter massiliensis TaxID=1852371 RepID=A0ABV1JA95_9ACTN|nr:cyclodeaminase/cyclohydrolase family protein [Raoultibacter massiliensis]